MPHMRWDAVRVQGAVPTIKNHTATPLSRTELLIFGGYDGRCNHNSLYLFNSATSTWTPLKAPIVRGTPPAGRNGHTATLAERKLFIVGGWLGSGPLAADDMHVLALEEQHMVWSKPCVVGKAPGPCNMHTADYIVHLRSILVFRGGDGREYLNDLHALHIDTMEWGRVVASGRLPVPRANHSSTVVNGDQIVVFGGWDGQRRLNDIHVLDTRRMVWSSVEIHSALPHPRAGMTFTRHRDRVFLFGGSGPSAKCYNDLHIYDPHETRWVDVTALPDEQQLGSMAAAILEEDEEDDDEEEEEEEEEDEDHRDETEHEGGAHHHHHHHERHRSTRGYSVGNTEYSGDGGLFDAYAYEDEDISSYANPNDIHTHHHRDQVVVVGMGPGQRAGHTCSVLEDRKLFVFGGSCGNDYLNDFYVLDTDPAPRAMISSTASPLHVLQKSLRHFVNSDEFSDISFLVEGRVVYAHKIILSLLSERFRGMFSGGFRESHEKQIVVPEIRYVVFVRMLEYLYSGECLEYEDDDDDRMAEAASADTSECEFVFHEDKTRRFSNGNDAARSSQFMAYDHHSQDGDGDRRRRATIGCFGGLTPMARASSFYPRPMGVTASSSFDLDVLLELLVVADQFMLDHLKQYCERVLQHAVHVDSVGDILAAANESNAVQLKAICMHFLRNHEIQWVEQGHDDEDDNCFDDRDDDNCFDDQDDEEEAEADGVLDEEPIDCSRRLTGPCDL